MFLSLCSDAAVIADWRARNFLHRFYHVASYTFHDVGVFISPPEYLLNIFLNNGKIFQYKGVVVQH